MGKPQTFCFRPCFLQSRDQFVLSVLHLAEKVMEKKFKVGSSSFFLLKRFESAPSDGTQQCPPDPSLPTGRVVAAKPGHSIWGGSKGQGRIPPHPMAGWRGGRWGDWRSRLTLPSCHSDLGLWAHGGEEQCIFNSFKGIKLVCV